MAGRTAGRFAEDGGKAMLIGVRGGLVVASGGQDPAGPALLISYARVNVAASVRRFLPDYYPMHY